MKHSKLFKNWGTIKKGMDAKSLQLSFANHLEYSLAKDQYTATANDMYESLSLAVRDRMIERWIRTQQTYHDQNAKRIYYLSAEYLLGRMLVNNMINLGIYEETRQAMAQLNVDLEELTGREPDMGLGNGGLGRLAACFLDSMATLSLPSQGYGIRYEYGIFDQDIRNLGQYELPENWLKHGNPWEIPRPEYSFTVHFGGRVEQTRLPGDRLQTKWVDTDDVVGIAYDMPVQGYGNDTVNTLRLWSARASKEFDLQYFQGGDYLKAVEQKNISENISKVLYPNDEISAGRELRLKQQYFFVSCSIQDIIRRYRTKHDTFDAFPDKVAIQMNDTHPSLAIAELMRILLDDYGMAWQQAVDITLNTCAYTNHTLLSEALERWPVPLFERLLPRHMMIIYEINRYLMRDVAVRYVDDTARLGRMSIIEELPERQIRMAHLAVVGSHSVNGVAQLHSRLVRDSVFKDFHEMYPDRFNNKTNGVTPRRWLLAANPALSSLISERIGDRWITDLSALAELEPLVDDAAFGKAWRSVKQGNKERLAAETLRLTGVRVDPHSIFDVQVKRIHEYKRQMLNLLHVIVSWLRMKQNPDPDPDASPRTFLFGGKAAPSYTAAKQIISLICHVGEMLNRDSTTNKRIQLVFLPNYRVSLAEIIFPAADLSEQISTAGFEASGTSNMKFALNGALTIGTLDGATIEIRDAVGEENAFIFGMTAGEVSDLRPHYRPWEIYEASPLLRRALDLIRQGFFNPEEKERFVSLADSLIHKDRYMVLADFDAYCRCQAQAEEAYRDPEAWTRMAIRNVARMGRFSSDRTITEYNRDIWRVDPVPIIKGNGNEA